MITSLRALQSIALPFLPPRVLPLLSSLPMVEWVSPYLSHTVTQKPPDVQGKLVSSMWQWRSLSDDEALSPVFRYYLLSVVTCGAKGVCLFGKPSPPIPTTTAPQWSSSATVRRSFCSLAGSALNPRHSGHHRGTTDAQSNDREPQEHRQTLTETPNELNELPLLLQPLPLRRDLTASKFPSQLLPWLADWLTHWLTDWLAPWSFEWLRS